MDNINGTNASLTHGPQIQRHFHRYLFLELSCAFLWLHFAVWHIETGIGRFNKSSSKGKAWLGMVSSCPRYFYQEIQSSTTYLNLC